MHCTYLSPTHFTQDGVRKAQTVTGTFAETPVACVEEWKLVELTGENFEQSKVDTYHFTNTNNQDVEMATIDWEPSMEGTRGIHKWQKCMASETQMWRETHDGQRVKNTVIYRVLF